MQTAISRRSFIATIPLAIGALTTLAGCGDDSGSGILDLTGTWQSFNEGNGTVSMTACISDDEIIVALGDAYTYGAYTIFWVGSYEAPDKAGNSWSWESLNSGYDKAESDVDKIKFTYKKGILSFNASKYGLTQNAEMECVSDKQALKRNMVGGISMVTDASWTESTITIRTGD